VPLITKMISQARVDVNDDPARTETKQPRRSQHDSAAV
jgi:hypothetical protein